jgi:hypothetical protein
MLVGVLLQIRCLRIAFVITGKESTLTILDMVSEHPSVEDEISVTLKFPEVA